jgi:ADP-ribose pyrophosphatase YjhB (NUDIX family)
VTAIHKDGRRFRVRTAGVALRRGRVLVHGAEGFRHVVLPGGGVEQGEASDAALVREMTEELDARVRVGRLLWVVESLFRDEGEDRHEIGFYWEMTVPETAACVRRDDFETVDGGVRLRLAWVPLADLDDLDLVPRFVIEGLRDPPRETRFLVLDERASAGP